MDSNIYINTNLCLKNYIFFGTGCGSNTYFSLQHYKELLYNIDKEFEKYKKFSYAKKYYKDTLKQLLKENIIIKFDDLDEYISIVSRKQHRENVFNLL